MTDFAFYNEIGDGPRGLKRAVVAVRRLLRRLLRPIFLRQAELMASLASRLDDHVAKIDEAHRRIDRTSDEIQDTIALGWDYVAMVRRVAALEDRIEALQSRELSARDDDGQLSLPFPDLDVNTAHAKAC
ncbi:MAG: hypothetical protein JWN86_1284 [Planctomycetota bacterium]|nr:hypothetical protein [Planctomycetota bacterium]